MFRVVELARVDDVDVLARDGDVREEVLVVEAEVRVLVVERDDALVGEENLPADMESVSVAHPVLRYYD